MRCAFPWNESKENWKMNTTAAHLLISSLAGVTNQPFFFFKNALKAFNNKILTRSGLKRSLQVYTLSSQLWWINHYTGQECQKKKKKQKEMLKRKLDMKKIKIDIPFRLTL